VVGTLRLLAMAREAGVSHVVCVSIVGIEGVGYLYYKAKLAAEAIVKENIVPWVDPAGDAIPHSHGVVPGGLLEATHDRRCPVQLAVPAG
jgi:hypothetical protein